MATHVFYEFADTVDQLLASTSPLDAQSWYGWWKSWLAKLVRAPIERDGFGYGNDVLYYGSVLHVREHPEAFQQFLVVVQQRLSDWFDLFVQLHECYTGVNMSVESNYTNTFGEVHTRVDKTDVVPFLMRHAVQGKYLPGVPYTSALHGAVRASSGLTVYQDAAWETFRSGGAHNAWSDLGIIFDTYCESIWGETAYRDQSWVSNAPDTPRGTRNAYADYVHWRDQRRMELQDLSWDDLPEIYRSEHLWRDLIMYIFSSEASSAEEIAFTSMPTVCVALIARMKEAFLGLSSSVELDEPTLYTMLYNMVPRDSKMDHLELDLVRLGDF